MELAWSVFHQWIVHRASLKVSIRLETSRTEKK